MATTREQFIKLRKSGVDPVKAREEVMKTVAPVTPSPTASINQMQYEINKQNRQNMADAWTIPQVWTSEAGQTQSSVPNPVLPTAPTTTPSGATMSSDGTVAPPPVTPTTPATPITPVSPTTPTTPVTETPTPTPTTPTAVTPVVDKVSETKAKNEAQMALNKQQAELKQAERDKLTAEANNQLANNEWAILASLKTGWMIPESVKSSPFYKSAQQTYNKLQQYSTYSTNELVTAMNQGSIVPWTNVYNDMMKDPVMKQKLTDAQVYRAWNPVNSTQIYENASSDIMSNNPTTANYLADGVITQAEYDQATNNTQVVAKAKEVEDKANKYNTLKAEYDSIEDEVNKQFPWSPFADSIIADRQKAKYKNLVLAKWEWETATGTLTELKSQASTLFETNLNLAEKRREEVNKVASEERQVQAQIENTKLSAKLSKENALYQNELTQWNAQFQTIWDKVYKVQNGVMTDTGIKSEPNTTYQAVWGKLYKIKWDSITDTGISAIEPTKPATPDWKQDQSGNWYNANSSTSPMDQIWSWNKTWTYNPKNDSLTTLTLENGKPIKMLSEPANALATLINWNPDVKIDYNNLYRDQADQFRLYGKGRTSEQLMKEGIPSLYADPTAKQVTWTTKSQHMTGSAVDVVKPTSEIIAKMNSAWFFQPDATLKAGDSGHFEYKGTGSTGIDTKANQNLSLYRAYAEDQKLPSKDALKWLWMTSQQFIDNADAGYDSFLKTKAKEISDTYPTLDIEYTGNYAGQSPTQKEKLNESVTKIWDIDSRISQLKALFEKNGTEVWPTADKSVMESLRKQIILKAKEVENLGVLNWPDLGILEDLLPSTTWLMSWLFSFDSNTMAKINNIQNNYRTDAKTKAINYGARLNFKWDQPITQSNISSSNTTPFTVDSLDNEWLNFQP